MVAAVVFGGIAVANRRAYVASIQARAEQDAQPADRRGAAAHRPGTARRRRPHHGHHQRAGRRWPLMCCPPGRRRPPRPWRRSGRPARKGSGSCAPSSTCCARPMTPTRPSPPRAPPSSTRSSPGARQAGLPTTFTVTGTPVPLPAAVDLAAYRIVQESLTNAIRHAGPATAAVSLTYRDGELLVEVADTGRGPPRRGPAVPGAGATGWPGCASGPPPSAGPSRPAPARRRRYRRPAAGPACPPRRVAGQRRTAASPSQPAAARRARPQQPGRRRP